MKEITIWMKQEERNEIVRKAIIRAAKSLSNACKYAYDKNKCEGCVFKVSGWQCGLNGHPLGWDERMFKDN